MAMRMHSKASVLCLGATFLLSSGAFSQEIHHITQPAASDRPPALHKTVVLSDSLDAYFPLALEIAEREELQLELEIEKAILRDPAFLLWVISPGALSEQVMTELGIMMRDHGSPLSVGFITGSTIESARRLYERKFTYSSGHTLVDDPGKTITHITGDSTAVMPLDLIDLRQTLRNTSYLCYSGHGAGGYWRLGDEMFLKASDIEPLPPLVVSSGACQTFRLFDAASIALAFTDLGAAAYAGFVFSPAPYYHFGFTDGFPMLFTYPEFPIGVVIALQNRGSLASFARFPFYFLLGDPRSCFRNEKPYRIADDRTEGTQRILRFEEVPEGFIPVRIEEGASYSFIDVEGVSAAGRNDVFYNSKLQFIDYGGDMYILFAHGGGDLTIRLKREEPFFWAARDALIDALDHAFVYIPTTGGTLFLLIVAASVLFVTVVHSVRSGGRIRGFYAALTAGLCVAGWRGLYALFRLDDAAIVSTRLGFEGRFAAATLILAGCGAILYFNVRSRLWRVGTVLVMTFPIWAVALFWAAGITYMNLAGAIPRLGTPIYSYTLSVMPAAAFALECLMILLLLRLLSRLFVVRS